MQDCFPTLGFDVGCDCFVGDLLACCVDSPSQEASKIGFSHPVSVEDHRLYGLWFEEIEQKSLQRERAIVATQTKQERFGESQTLAFVLSEEFCNKQRLSKYASGKSRLLGEKQSAAEMFALEVSVDKDGIWKMAKRGRITVNDHQGLCTEKGRKFGIMCSRFDKAVFVGAYHAERRRGKVLAACGKGDDIANTRWFEHVSFLFIRGLMEGCSAG